MNRSQCQVISSLIFPLMLSVVLSIWLQLPRLTGLPVAASVALLALPRLLVGASLFASSLVEY